MRTVAFVGILSAAVVASTGCAKIFGIDGSFVMSDGGVGEPCNGGTNATPCGEGLLCAYPMGTGSMAGGICSAPCDMNGPQCPGGESCTNVNVETSNQGMSASVCLPEGNGGSGSGSSSGGTPQSQIIATSQSGPSFLALAGQNVVWTDNAGQDGIDACSASGCSGGAPAQLSVLTQEPEGIVGGMGGLVSASGFLWTDQARGTISACDSFVLPSGCTSVMTVVSGQFGPIAVAVDSQSVYWTNVQSPAAPTGRRIFKCTPTTEAGAPSCPAQDLGAGSIASFPAMIEVSGGFVYWANALPPASNPSGGVMATRCAVSGCGTSMSQLAGSGIAPHGVQGIAVDGSNFYFTVEGGQKVMFEPLTGGGANTLGQTMQVGPYSNGNAFVPAGVRVDAKYVYWASLGTGQIVYCPLGGCASGTPPTLLATVSGTNSTGVSLAQDTTFLYWADRSAGVVARVAKPQ